MSYKNNIPKYFIYTFLIYFYLWLPIWVVFFQQKGMNLHQIGLFDAFGYILIAAFEIPTGIVADKFGKKYSLAIGALIYTIGMLGIIADLFSFWFILGFILWNISNTFFSGVTTAILYDSLVQMKEEDKFQSLIGKTRAVVIISQTTGSILGGILAAYNMNLCFILTGILSGFAIILALSMKEPVLQSDPEDDVKNQKYWEIIKKAISITVKNSTLRYLILYSSLLSCFTFLITYTIYQPYAMNIGFSISTLGFFVFFIKFASIIGNLLTERFSKKLDIKILVALLPFVISICLILMGLVSSKLSIIFLIIISLVSSLISPAISKLVNDEIPSSYRATILSLEGLLWTGLMGLLEPIVLVIADYYSIMVAVLAAGITLLLFSLIIYYFWLKNHMKSADKTSISFDG